MSETPWEPPFDGTEAEHLLGALNRQRATFRWKADGLAPAGLSAGIGASHLTIGGLLKHLAFVEDHLSTVRLDGTHPLGPWDPANWEEDEDWEFSSAAQDSPETLYALYDSCVARARDRVAAALTHGGLDQHVALTGPDDTPVSLRRLLFDLLEEYGRHTGHTDLLRESVDGRVGEDPPAGWRPGNTSAA